GVGQTVVGVRGHGQRAERPVNHPRFHHDLRGPWAGNLREESSRRMLLCIPGTKRRPRFVGRSCGYRLQSGAIVVDGDGKRRPLDPEELVACPPIPTRVSSRSHVICQTRVDLIKNVDLSLVASPGDDNFKTTYRTSGEEAQRKKGKHSSHGNSFFLGDLAMT